MSGKEQRRAWSLTKLLVGELTGAEAAAPMQLSQRQVWRLKVSVERDGPGALVHANRGGAIARASPSAHGDAHRVLRRVASEAALCSR